MHDLAGLKNRYRDALLALIFVGIASCSSDERAAEGLKDNPELEEASVIELHAAALVLDAHADIVIPSTSASYLSDDGSSKVSLDKMRAGGVDAARVHGGSGQAAGSSGACAKQPGRGGRALGQLRVQR